MATTCTATVPDLPPAFFWVASVDFAPATPTQPALVHSNRDTTYTPASVDLQPVFTGWAGPPLTVAPGAGSAAVNLGALPTNCDHLSYTVTAFLGTTLDTVDPPPTDLGAFDAPVATANLHVGALPAGRAFDVRTPEWHVQCYAQAFFVQVARLVPLDVCSTVPQLTLGLSAGVSASADAPLPVYVRAVKPCTLPTCPPLCDTSLDVETPEVEPAVLVQGVAVALDPACGSHRASRCMGPRPPPDVPSCCPPWVAVTPRPLPCTPTLLLPAPVAYDMRVTASPGASTATWSVLVPADGVVTAGVPLNLQSACAWWTALPATTFTPTSLGSVTVTRGTPVQVAIGGAWVGLQPFPVPSVQDGAFVFALVWEAVQEAATVFHVQGGVQGTSCTGDAATGCEGASLLPVGPQFDALRLTACVVTQALSNDVPKGTLVFVNMASIVQQASAFVPITWTLTVL